MQKSFANVEEMIADDEFLSWFYKENAEKVQSWENWLEKNPSFRALAAEAVEMMTTLEITEKPISSFKIESSFKKLNSKLDELDKREKPVVDIKSLKKRWWISAAAAILLLFAGLAYFNFNSSSKPIIATQYGQISQQVLPDGSQVMLNANTIVTLSKDWKEGDDREVWLKGEAFFHVKKTVHKNRFIVHTDQLDVIVTGTQFNVSTLNDKTSVLLTEGSVTIKTTGGEEIMMKPGDFVVIADNKTEKRTADEEAILAWKDNKLNFDKTPMREVAAMISNHYGVAVTFADDSVSKKPITGVMPNDNLDVLLNALEATNDFRITRSDKAIVIANP